MDTVYSYQVTEERMGTMDTERVHIMMVKGMKENRTDLKRMMGKEILGLLILVLGLALIQAKNLGIMERVDCLEGCLGFWIRSGELERELKMRGRSDMNEIIVCSCS
jgi:hypothetical protein